VILIGDTSLAAILALFAPGEPTGYPYPGDAST
jgi:hypothetical protein